MTVTLPDDSSITGVQYQYSSSGDFSAEPIYPLSESGTFTVDSLTAETAYTFRVRSVAGDQFSYWADAEAKTSATVDGTFYVGTWTIRDNPEKINTHLSYLFSDISGVDTMRISNDGITWTDWMAYEAEYGYWHLVDTDGLKTVRIEYQDSLGNIYLKSDSVILDDTPPVAAFSINNGAVTACSNTVTLNIECSDDDVAEISYRIAGGYWSDREAFSSEISFFLSGSEHATCGAEVRLYDDIGNMSVYTDDIIMDSVAVWEVSFDYVQLYDEYFESEGGELEIYWDLTLYYDNGSTTLSKDLSLDRADAISMPIIVNDTAYGDISGTLTDTWTLYVKRCEASDTNVHARLVMREKDGSVADDDSYGTYDVYFNSDEVEEDDKMIISANLSRLDLTVERQDNPL